MTAAGQEQDYNRVSHPVDLMEHIACLQDWVFERSSEDELTVSVAGSWCDYHISFNWRDDLGKPAHGVRLRLQGASRPDDGNLPPPCAHQRTVVARPLRHLVVRRVAPLSSGADAERRERPRSNARRCSRPRSTLVSGIIRLSSLLLGRQARRGRAGEHHFPDRGPGLSEKQR